MNADTLRTCKHCGEPEKTKAEHPKGGDFGWFDAPESNPNYVTKLVCLRCGENPTRKRRS